MRSSFVILCNHIGVALFYSMNSIELLSPVWRYAARRLHPCSGWGLICNDYTLIRCQSISNLLSSVQMHLWLETLAAAKVRIFPFRNAFSRKSRGFQLCTLLLCAPCVKVFIQTVEIMQTIAPAFAPQLPFTLYETTQNQ